METNLTKFLIDGSNKKIQAKAFFEQEKGGAWMNLFQETALYMLLTGPSERGMPIFPS